MRAGSKDAARDVKILRVEFIDPDVGKAVVIRIKELVIEDASRLTWLLQAEDPLLSGPQKGLCVLTKTNELTAMKATGISLYRVIVPVLVIAGVLAVALFLFDQSYLPSANRRQEALRSIIKGKPAQTFLRPGQQWIFGLQQPGQPGRIFYYQFFDSDHDRFANIWVYEFDPENFSHLAQHLCFQRALGTPAQRMDLRARLGPALYRRYRQQLQPFQGCEFSGDHGETAILQDGGPAVSGDELRRAQALHCRPAAERL